MEIGIANVDAVEDLGIGDGVRAHTEDGIDPLVTGGISESIIGDVPDLEDTLYDIVHYMSKVPLDMIIEFETDQRQLEAEIHNIKQRDEETLEEFMERSKIDVEQMNGAPKCMRISRFMYGVSNPELTKCLNEHVPKTVKEMMTATTAFIQGKTDAAFEKKRVTRQKVTQSFAHVKEITFPPLTTNKGIEGPLVIEAEIGGHAVHRIYVDGGSSMEWGNYMAARTVRALGNYRGRRALYKSMDEFYDSEVTVTVQRYHWKAWNKRNPSSTIHGSWNDQVPGEWQNKDYCSIILTPTECATIAATPKDYVKKTEACHENFKVAIHPDFPDQEITIGGTVSTKAQTELCTLLKGNLDIFAWQPSDMTRVPRSIFEHRLDIREGYSLIRQKKQGQAPEHAKAIQVKVQKLVEVGILLEVYYHDWLSNPVMKSIRRLNPSAATPLSVSWIPTKAIIKYRWQNKMRKIRLSTPVTSKRHVSRIHDQSGRNKTVLRQDGGRVAAPIPTDNQREVHQKSDFHWTPEAEQAFKQRKQHLAKLPMLVEPKPKEELIMYLSASYGAISAVWMTKRDTVQTPIYFISRALSGAGLMLTSPEGIEFTYPLRFQFIVSNNEAEYEALIAGLRIAAHIGVRNVHMTPIIEYLRDETLPDNRKEARKLRIKARQYELLEGILYRRSFLKPWLRCVGPLQVDYVIREIHEGSCSMHAGPRYMVAKAMRPGYYWPTMYRDAREMIRKYKDCQIRRPVPRNPQQPLTPITAPWPFYKWGIDIAGLFPEGSGKVKFLIVAMDYFTKGIEAKAAATITGSQVKKFVWDNMVCHFGLPGEIVSDNGKQFSGDPFKDWCETLNILQHFASVKHLQSNGLVERANRSLGEGIKACLEIGMPTYRTTVVDAVHNDKELRLNLDLLEEKRERAAICVAKAKLKMTKYYNARVSGVTFRPGYFVYCSYDANHTVNGGKLGPKWEGPYEVTESLGDGAYKLRSTDGTVLSRTWNIANLKKCYLLATALAWMNWHYS
nr:reverse transcriptase domain-containing protein [Tanacetum cinerariifolium]